LTPDFPVKKRGFYPQQYLVSRFSGEPQSHSLNYRSGEIYTYRIKSVVFITLVIDLCLHQIALKVLIYGHYNFKVLRLIGKSSSKESIYSVLSVV